MFREDQDKIEVEWFKMNELSWQEITKVLVEISHFVEIIKSLKPIQKINVNTASLIQLKSLPLIGKSVASNIIATRTEKPFTGFKDMELRVKKLGIGTINAFRDFVAFDDELNDVKENQLININL